MTLLGKAEGALTQPNIEKGGMPQLDHVERRGWSREESATEEATEVSAARLDRLQRLREGYRRTGGESEVTRQARLQQRVEGWLLPG